VDFEWRLRCHTNSGTHANAHSGTDTCSDPGAHTGTDAHTDSCSDAYSNSGPDTCSHSCSDADGQLSSVCERPYLCDRRQGHQCR